ncbi:MULTISPECIES: Phenylacetic acid catabolic protein [Streptosporangium]|uniref:Ring-1,2-phenylacetyl-CoA epoxidase subunit PaaA n=1 Tax=Streptosporangium brasiliense TaxID=47480 RepID=A0ABT9RLL7_9ACTN|nr:Phenylacetic acid catabolic protein [Streptosporangium brasiliense]MDP9870193.1 ring-1,2-phenylacetyl-CoA epoxidase subunit PaaA [Streptosporangium brasiliense]
MSNTLGVLANQVVSGPEEARALGDDYVTAVGKILNSHVRNEAAGAAIFDEPSIALAPTPREKWLACRMAMEEYGHHLKFNKLAAELGVEDPHARSPLSVFEYEVTTWTEYVMTKAIVDLAEVVLMEDLAHCSYLPLRKLCRSLMPEERFHVGFGTTTARQLAADPAGRDEVRRAAHELITMTLPFFGRSDSRNNETFRRWGIKRMTNDECRAEFVRRTRALLEEELELDHPEVDVRWHGTSS